MAELGKAYVQIIPSAKGISGAISKELGGDAAQAGTAAGKTFGSSMVSAFGKIVAAVGVGKMFKSALDEAGDLQQSFGGLDTIYGDAADAAKAFAKDAAEMGISANDYAEQAVSFGAALRQSYGGDTVAAAEAANEAIKSMADNSAKFGTDIGSIQNAFQGFAKQNYTMLDNLKLGYGGTKTEMERLLKDATALSGIDYNIDNLGDVYKAIGVIQEELGVAGVAAEEAKTTLTGSFGAMRAAAKNLLGNIALGEDITENLAEVSDAVVTWARNLLPLIGNVFKSLPKLLSSILSAAVKALGSLGANAQNIAQVGVDILTRLIEGIISAVPQLVGAAVQIVSALGQALMSVDWLGLASQLLTSLRSALDSTAGSVFSVDTSIISSILQGITNALPGLLSASVEIITNLVTGILQDLPQLITTAGELIKQFFEAIITNAPTLLSAGVELLLNVINGIIESLPDIAAAAIQVVGDLLKTFLENAPDLIEGGVELVINLISGLIESIPDVIAAAGEIADAIWNKLAEIDWIGLGVAIIEGIINGLLSLLDWLWSIVEDIGQGIYDGFCWILGIESPSKVMADAAKWIPAGIAEGITDNASVVEDALDSIRTEAVAGITAISTQAAGSYAGAQPGGANSDVLDALRGIAEQQTEVNVTLEGDAAGVFKLVKQENYKTTKATGYNLLAMARA